MKRKLTLLLVLALLMLCVFTLFSCKKWIRVDTLTYYEGGTKLEYDSSTITTTIKVYLDPTSGYDVDDFKEVKIKYCVVEGKDNFSKKITKEASIPENARGNPDLQYFYITLENERINPDNHFISVQETKGVLKADETMTDDSSTPSVFGTIMLGLLIFVLAMVPSCLGLATRDDLRGIILIAISIIIPIAINIAMYVAWGVGRGIIVSIFCALIVLGTIIASRFIDY
ncbi:MAG: hypothetical protein II980_03850 [Clostridia bacterium]|nr:hypothetical protein [Clostridia bacterium]